MSWIAGWNKRIKLTISGSCIEGDLSNFPVMVHLDSTCSGVFNELGSNSKRISLVTFDQQQCYVEVERWDETNKKAWLWVKVPTLSSGVSSDLYLYYDNLHPDNSVYVGTVGETSAQNVWDNNFVGVWHMNQDPTGGSNCVKDSTSNANHGTPAGSMTSGDLVDGKIGKALDFDGSDDYIDTTASIIQNGTATIEMTIDIIQQASAKGDYMYLTNNYYIHSANDYIYAFNTSDYFKPAITVGWQCLAIIYDGNTSTSKLYHNTVLYNVTQQPAAHDINAWNGRISDITGGNTALYGISEEVRVSNAVRPASWIKATYYSNWGSLINYGTEETVSSGILPGWNNRLKLTIQNDHIDNTLTDFPVMIKLSDSSGFNSYDNRSVFYELEANINRKKIAITDSTGVLQCFVEIERFSCEETEAILWTRLPIIYDSIGTHFYLYYDKTQADNISFVGDVNSIVAQNVWDDNFVGVWHMNQDPTGGSSCIKDSTSKANHGTPGGSMTSADLVDGKIGKALDFDGSDDLIDCGDSVSFNIVNQITVETIVSPVSPIGVADFFINKYATDKREWALRSGSVPDEAKIEMYFGDPADGSFEGLWKTNVEWLVASTWQYVVSTFTGGTVVIYYNGDAKAGSIGSGSIPTTLNNEDATVRFGEGGSGQSSPYSGKQDEVRISNVARSASWIKATYRSNWDSLIVYEKEDISAAWLDDWSKRIKLTIDHTKIDNSLTDFPVLITLTSGVQSDFFSELYLSKGITWYDHAMACGINQEGTYDTTHAHGGSVVKWDDTYKMWYGGNDGTNWRVLYATSVDGTVWSNHQMVISIGAEGTYDTTGSFQPSVIKDGTLYKMWYSGDDGTYRRILYATSTNGTTWSNHQMVINIGVEGTYDTAQAYAPSVTKDDDIYKMWYTGYDGTNFRILYATSTNGTTWSNHQMVINIGVEGTYDTAQAYAPSVVKDGSTYKIWYTGKDATTERVLYTTSTNGTTWSNHQMVINIGAEGTYDTFHAGHPSVLKIGDTYKIWYSGNSGSARILCAHSNDSDLNRKKIAVTKNNGTTQCPVEIEQWDFYNGKVNLWTKIPTVVFDNDTDIYLYYDKTKEDNVDYVGDVGSTPGRSVWANGFVGVWHMNQDPTGGSSCIKDSTSNSNHGTPAGSMTSGDLVDGKIGKALDFDGSDDRIEIPDHSILRGMSSITVEGVLNIVSKGNYEKLIDYASASALNTDRKYRVQFDGAGDQGLVFVLNDDTNTEIGHAVIAAFPTSTVCCFVGVYTGLSAADSVKIYKDGILNSSGAGTGNSVNNNSAGDLWLAGEQFSAPYHCYDGLMDETRISNIARSASWIKATYYSNWNTLLTQSSVQNYTSPPAYYYHGYVKEKGIYVSRKVYLYRRDTGLLIDNCMSNAGTGYYLLETSVSGEHFVVALDDDAGDDYNALVQDRLYPNDM